VPEADPPRSGSDSAGQRVATNTFARALGEIVGKFASLAVFIALAREVGASEFGMYVFAFSWVQVATMPIALGAERYILHEVARNPGAKHALLVNGIALKLLRAVPITALSFVLLELLGYGGTAREAVYILTVGQLIEALSRTLFAVFNGVERGTLVGTTIVIQRVGAAALGLAAIAAGGGVVAVSATFTIGTAVGFVVGLILMSRSIGLPRPRLDREVRVSVARASRGYGLQDILGVMLAKVDVVILSLLATSTAVGLYGAAYRLLESTFFIGTAVVGAFAAMYTYLGRHTDPSVQTVFERSIKLVTALLLPCAVGFGLLAEPAVVLIFGEELEDAAVALKLLAPTVVFMGVVTLGSSLLIARDRLRVLIVAGIAAVVVNVGLNLALIPSLDEAGAATAMLVTSALLAVIVLVRAAEAVGGVPWTRMLAAPLAAAAAMAAPLALIPWALPALAVGLLAYAGAYVAVERAISPSDLRYVLDFARRRLPAFGLRREAA
jgi:O-antigen/teichoic acid export membrane protein